MDPAKQLSIERNLDELTRETRNYPDILERLQAYDVLTATEIDQLSCCSDEETSITMLYLMVARKPLSNFDLLLYVLQDTDNEMLAKLLEESLKSGDHSRLPGKHLPRDICDEEKNTEHAGLVLISGGEVGIAEILNDYEQLRDDWKKLFRILKLPNACTKGYQYENNFVVQATLILKDWSDHLKKRATVDNLCRILNNEGLDHCSARIYRMFDRYVISGFAFDFPGRFTIKGKIRAITSVLDNNPSFCFYPERLLLMLNLSQQALPEFTQDARFPKIAEKMLTRWSEENPNSASTDHLASLLALNGHFHTCDKISTL